MKEIHLPSIVLRITAATALFGGSVADTQHPIESGDYPEPAETMWLPDVIGMNVQPNYVIEKSLDTQEELIGPQKPSDEVLLQLALEELERGVAQVIEEERIRKVEEERIVELAEPQESLVSAASARSSEFIYIEGDTVWDMLVICEASGNWAANTGNGFEGGLQFHPDTWLSNKNPDMPLHAYEATREQQIIVAERVLATQGWAAWPGCSEKYGLR